MCACACLCVCFACAILQQLFVALCVALPFAAPSACRLRLRRRPLPVRQASSGLTQKHISSISICLHFHSYNTHKHTHNQSHTHTSLQFALFLLASIFFHSHCIFLNGMHRTSLFKSSSLKCAALCMCVRCACVCVCVCDSPFRTQSTSTHPAIINVSSCSCRICIDSSCHIDTTPQTAPHPPFLHGKGKHTHERRSLPATFEWACRERQAKLRVPSAYSSFCILNCDADRPESTATRSVQCATYVCVLLP